MRPRSSFTGPIVLIAIGVVFLIHSLSPEFRMGDLLSNYWPYVLIAWGSLEFIEICFRFFTNRPLPPNGVSGLGWLAVVVICLLGFSAFQIRQASPWMRWSAFERGIRAFGEEREFSVNPIQQNVGRSPRLIIESFRGDAKIVGVDGEEMTVGGHKLISAFDQAELGRANDDSPVNITVQGNTVVLRCNQGKARSGVHLSTNLDISVPKGASVEITGTRGDFDISGLSGSVDVSSENAGIRLKDIDGAVKIDTRRSDLIRCNNVKGTVDLRGHGADVELTKIAGQVTISGSYTGSLALRDLAKAVRVENSRTEFNVQGVPGEIRVDRGSVSMENVVGPTRLTTRVTDVSLSNFTEGLELSVDKGDVELNPGRVPLGRMVVHARSGNIELAIPQSAAFAMSAITDHGEVSNDFGEALKTSSEGRGARLSGAVGSGPEVKLATERGRITVRKANGSGTRTVGGAAEAAGKYRPVTDALR
ncbi:MAG: DUF4097 family beta strand repeat-containing protein [Bryobacteraceae bacterium]